MRLDDAAPQRDMEKWNRMEALLDKYNIKPLIGVIPDCRDEEMKIFATDNHFWERIRKWTDKGYSIAMHGYQHIYYTEDGGINPVNPRSEFAGLSYEEQKIKIEKGVGIMRSHGIDPKIFFAPSHTFDKETLNALKDVSNIRIISDTVANKPYSKYGFTFVPQQSGSVRKLPFGMVTFCYHPNTMKNDDFTVLEMFLAKYQKRFIRFPEQIVKRRKNIVDILIERLYFMRRK